MHLFWTRFFHYNNLTVLPCFLDGFPTSLTRCGTLDGVRKRWDFKVNFVEEIWWISSHKLSLKLRLRLNLPLSGSKIRSSTNNSLLKLSPIYSTSSATPSFPSITSTNSSLSTHYKSPTATHRSPNITSPPSTTIPVPTSPIRIQETWQTAGLHSSQSSSSQIHTTNPSFTTSTIFL